MKAIVCREFGPVSRLEWADVALPEPQPGQVRVTLRAAALNFMDTLIVQGHYQLKPPLPFSPGAEMAGVVSAVGGGPAELPKLGAAVIVRRSYGCLSEEVIADAGNVLSITTPNDWGAAAALSVAYTTAYHALVQRANLQAGETVLVLGAAGGVGTAAIQVAHALGARVIAACAGTARAAVCKAAGADETVDYSAGDLRAQLRVVAAGGINVVVDTVGGDHAEPALRSLVKEGRYLIVGFAAGGIPRIAANLLLLKGASAIGINADFSREKRAEYQQIMNVLFGWMNEGVIRPVISATFPMAQSIEALQRLGNREFHGKVVIVP